MINNYPINLLVTLEHLLDRKSTYQNRSRLNYRDPQEINLAAHIRLKQDKDLVEYISVVHQMMINRTLLTTSHEHELYSNWQIKETYRIVNTALISSQMKHHDLEQLRQLKIELEGTPCLKTLLSDIKSGKIYPTLVCSGHGAAYIEDGNIDLSKSNATVITISGPGGRLGDSLAVDVENDLVEPTQIVITKRKTEDEEPEHEEEVSLPSGTSPHIYNRHTKTVLPQYSFFTSKSTSLQPKVIEVETGREELNINSFRNKKHHNFFTLSDVLARYEGQPRTIKIASCTIIQDNTGTRYGDFLGYTWRKSTLAESSFHSKRPKTETRQNTEPKPLSNGHK